MIPIAVMKALEKGTNTRDTLTPVSSHAPTARNSRQKAHPGSKTASLNASGSMSAASPTASNPGKENNTAEQLRNLKRGGDNYQREVYNGRKKLKRSQAATTDRSSSLVESRVENGQLRTEVGQLTVEVADSIRDLIDDLVALDGVRSNKVVGVLKHIAGKVGIVATGKAADRTVLVTLSSNGTTHKNINLESRRAIVINQNNEKQHFFLGIGMAINHTSEKQLEGWEDLIEIAYKIYKIPSAL
ncbi:hypothetical protein DFH09DRAFT_1089529 [Mycena vulgaris]|nr:hypothetical protein DFH09DRAFT_1089529 [Mycena vulgaris]